MKEQSFIGTHARNGKENFYPNLSFSLIEGVPTLKNCPFTATRVKFGPQEENIKKKCTPELWVRQAKTLAAQLKPVSSPILFPSRLDLSHRSERTADVRRVHYKTVNLAKPKP
jgi:hypothetical protein